MVRPRRGFTKPKGIANKVSKKLIKGKLMRHNNSDMCSGVPISHKIGVGKLRTALFAVICSALLATKTP